MHNQTNAEFAITICNELSKKQAKNYKCLKS